MPRIIQSAIQAVITSGSTPLLHLLSFSVGSTVYRFAEDTTTHLGFSYQSGLRLRSPIRYSEKLQMDPVVIELENISLAIAALLKLESVSIQGQEATLERLFLAAGETILLYRGRISEIEVNENLATITIAGDLDPVAARIPVRIYSALCTWNFKDANCGYVDNEDPLDPTTALPFEFCPKDFTSCELRGRQHRFPGFLHLTRDVSESLALPNSELEGGG